MRQTNLVNSLLISSIKLSNIARVIILSLLVILFSNAVFTISAIICRDCFIRAASIILAIAQLL